MVNIWKRLRLALLATIVLHGYGTCAVPVQAALTSSNIPAHTHASTQQGGALGAVNATSVTATGAVNGGSVTATGAVTGGSVATSGTLSSTKACATGYVRTGPNLCMATSQIAAWSAIAGCNQNTALTAVTDAKAVLATIIFQVNSNNAIGTRQVDLFVHGPTDTSCLTIVSAVTARAREEVAVVAGTRLLETAGTNYVFRSNSSGQTYFSTFSGTGNIYIRPVGYFD